MIQQPIYSYTPITWEVQILDLGIRYHSFESKTLLYDNWNVNHRTCGKSPSATNEYLCMYTYSSIGRIFILFYLFFKYNLLKPIFVFKCIFIYIQWWLNAHSNTLTTRCLPMLHRSDTTSRRASSTVYRHGRYMDNSFSSNQNPCVHIPAGLLKQISLISTNKKAGNLFLLYRPDSRLSTPDWCVYTIKNKDKTVESLIVYTSWHRVISSTC